MDSQAAEDQVSALKAAMELGVAVEATYNGTRITLAPHLIYRRHDAAHLAALNLTRLAGRKDADRLSVFRVSGLSELRLTREPALLKAHLLQTIEHPRDQVIATIEHR